MKMIISLSGKKQSGKSTLASHLVARHNFVEVSWAYPLKECIGRELFGLSDNQLYGPDHDKEATIEEWGMSAREILQKVGTDLFRNHIDQDFWVKIGTKKIKQQLDLNRRVVVSDTRFPNEVEAIKFMGGYSVEVLRVGDRGKKDTHASETALNQYEHDFRVQAFDGAIDALQNKMTDIINSIERNAFDEE